MWVRVCERNLKFKSDYIKIMSSLNLIPFRRPGDNYFSALAYTYSPPSTNKYIAEEDESKYNSWASADMLGNLVFFPENFDGDGVSIPKTSVGDSPISSLAISPIGYHFHFVAIVISFL